MFSVSILHYLNIFGLLVQNQPKVKRHRVEWPIENHRDGVQGCNVFSCFVIIVIEQTVVINSVLFTDYNQAITIQINLTAVVNEKLKIESHLPHINSVNFVLAANKLDVLFG
jgi:hypothetical protein